MADVTEKYSLEFETNASSAERQVRGLSETLDEMGRSGELSGKGLNQASRGILSIEKALGSASGSVKKYSDSFSSLRKEVSAATEALQKAAQDYVVGGGTDVLGAASRTMGTEEAKEILAIRKAEGLTAEQVASEVIAANNRKRQAEENYAKAMREGASRLEQIQKNRVAEESAAELKYHNQKMQRLQDEVARETAAVAKIQAERAKLNQTNAKAYQRAYTDPKSFLGQANSREASSGLKASDTTWAVQAKQQRAFRDELARTEVSFQSQRREAELTALRYQILARNADSAGSSVSDLGGRAERSSEGYVALRYALYDVSRTALVASGAIAGVGIAATSAFASQERAFTEVERIAEGSVEEVEYLRTELQKMSTEIPRTFQELSAIGSLGGALGIEAPDLDEFTETVAKFVTLTGVTEDAAATGFGRISQYLNIAAEDYEKLGSAVLRAGNISVATEEQVLKFSSAISLPAARAGLLADEVVALGAATASFANINVEGAGSAFSRVFANIERAVTEGGESLDKFAGAAGYSAEQFRVAWGSDAGGTFNRIIQGLSQDVDGLVANLDNLGVRNERDRRVVSALALNYQDYMRIVGETSNAWREGLYMNEAYGLVLDDLVSKWEIFQNALTNAAAAVGAEAAPALKSLLDVATNLIVSFTDFASTPLGETLIRMAATVGTLSAGILALGGVLAGASASGLAFRFALNQITSSGFVQALSALRGAIMGVGTASGTTAALVVTAGNALKYLGRVTVIGAVLYALSEAFFNTGEAAVWAGNVIIEFANFVRDAGQALNDFFGIAASAEDDLTYKFIKDAGTNLKNWGKSLGTANKGVTDFSAGQLGLNDALEDFNFEAPQAADNIGDIGQAAQETAEKVYTLVDYANDLSSVWNRAFEIRFSGQQTIDTVQNSIQKMRDAAADSAKRIQDMRNSIRSLTADIGSLKSDIGILEYYLRIAREYGDTKRATALEAELAKKRAELAEKTAELSSKSKDLKKEQDSQSKSLVGGTQAARDNRQSILDLVQQYQNHIRALAASGMSQDQLAIATQRLKEDFIRQATQLGYNRTQLMRYAKSFDDVRVAISKIPRNITVKVDGLGPAEKALREFSARAASQMSAAGSNAKNAFNNAIKGMGSNIPSLINPPRSNMNNAFPYPYASWQAFMSAMRARGMGSPLLKAQPEPWYSYFKMGLSMGYSSGGFTGTGGMYDVAGPVHRGEYVIPKRDVNQSSGLPYSDALGRLMHGAPSRTVAPMQPSQASGPATVALTAGTIQAIAQATGKNIYLDGRMIADASANVYAQQNTVGAY